jgi:hypothetical protein
MKSSLQPINRKARKLEELRMAAMGDVEALQQNPAAPGKVYYPVGCTLHFSPGWEVDVAGGTAGLCQPAERDLFDCYLGCSWPAQVPDHVSNNPDWSDKCAAATNDWRNVDVVYP